MMNFKTPALIAALAVAATSSFAASDNIQDDLMAAKADVKALSAQLETMGVDVDSTVDFNGPVTFTQQEAAYSEKAAELQSQLETIRQAN